MSFMRFKTWLAGLATVALVACGGGGGAGDQLIGGGGNSVGKAVAALQVKFSPASVDNSGAQTATATITAVDSSGQALSGVTLDEIRVDKNATYSISATTGKTTGTDGTVVAVVSIGNDTTLRTVTLTARHGSLIATGSLEVVDSKTSASDLTLVGPLSIQNSFANTITLTATAVDSNRNALVGLPIVFRVDDAEVGSGGATLVPSATVTDANGAIRATLSIGSDQRNRTVTVTATSGNVVRKRTVDIVGAKLTPSGFTSTVAASSTGNRVVYLLVDNTGAKMAKYPITVSGSGLADVVGETDADGQFVYTYTAPSQAQSMTLAAKAGGASSQETISVTAAVVIPPVTLAINSASVSASPNVVAVNSSASTQTNKTEIRALFLSTNNTPLKNVRVWFDLGGDANSIGGALDSKAQGLLMYSDANGVARTTYAPGTRSSPKDGVTVRVCYSQTDFAIPDEGQACPNERRTTLTVISESLSVSIGTNGLLGVGTSGATYTQRFVVQVVDAAGQAKAGVTVSPSIDLLRYYKGVWVRGATSWVQVGNGQTFPTKYPSGADVPLAAVSTVADSAAGIASCDNEDLNRNGVSENFFDFYQAAVISEDQNASGAFVPTKQILEPRKADVTISVENTAVTDANGIVVLKIEYPWSVASWVRYNILVAASGVAGTEGRASFQADLAPRATEVNNITATPAFAESPYGQASTPTYLRRNPEGQSGWLCTNPN